MKTYVKIGFLILIAISAVASSLDADFTKEFNLFYNYRFDEAESYFLDMIDTAEDPFPYYAFLSYVKIRSQLANAEYENAHKNTNKVIEEYRPIFENYLQQHPEDVAVQFYYTILLAGKMRIYLNKMEYLLIVKESPKILANKFTIDRYSKAPFADMDFGTGSFDYYLSVVGRNIGLGNLMINQQSDGIKDLWNAYHHAQFTKWEAAIALMYIYLYDKLDYETCHDLCVEFLKQYPDNLEVLAIATECAYYQNNWMIGDAYLRRINRLLNDGILHNDAGWRARACYLKGVKAMVKEKHVTALDYFNKVYEMNNIEYSWYQSIVLKYTGDVYLKMGLVMTAKLYYQETVNTMELIPHVREARNILKTLK